jgi:hypothetical protein
MGFRRSSGPELIGRANPIDARAGGQGQLGTSRVPTDTRRAHRTFTETELGFKTSEFYMMLIFAVAVIIAAYVSSADALSREDGWRFASFAVVAYIISRGLAKLGVREPYKDSVDEQY